MTTTLVLTGMFSMEFKRDIRCCCGFCGYKLSTSNRETRLSTYRSQSCSSGKTLIVKYTANPSPRTRTSPKTHILDRRTCDLRCGRSTHLSIKPLSRRNGMNDFTTSL